MRGEYKDTTGELTYGGRSGQALAQKTTAEIAFCGMSQSFSGASMTASNTAI